MNSDLDDRFIEQGDYRYALNIRNSRSDGEGQGAIENTKGNTLVAFDLPVGNNKEIGSYYDTVNNLAYYFVWNSGSNHLVLEYNPSINDIRFVLQSTLLGFDTSYPILHIVKIDDLLYWTDGLNEPRYLNIQNAKTGVYNYATDQYIDRIAWSPRDSPRGSYITDRDVSSNNTFGKLFQFRYCWVYDDNQESAWSPISKIIFPDDLILNPNNLSGLNILAYNAIEISFDTGIDKVKRIKIAAREGNLSDFYLIKDFDKSEAGLQDNTVHTFRFYNNEVKLPLPQSFVNRLFDYVPIKSESQTLIDGNRIVDGNITEGYDNIPIDVSVSSFINESSTQFNITDSLGGTSVNYNDFGTNTSVLTTPLQLPSASVTIRIFPIVQIIRSSMRVNISFDVRPNINPSQFKIVENYSENIDVNTGNIFNFCQRAANYFNSSGKLNQVFSIPGSTPQYNIQTTSTATNAGINSFIDVTVSLNSLTGNSNLWNITSYIIGKTELRKTLKRASKHQFGIAYQDKAGRIGLVQTSNDMILNVDESPIRTGIDIFGNPIINPIGLELTIRHQPPDWATNYQILYSGNLTHQRYLQIRLFRVILNWTGGGGNEHILYIGGSNSGGNQGFSYYNQITGASISYEFAKGDRIRFLDQTGVAITDFPIRRAGTDSNGYWVSVNSGIPITPSSGMAVELYTPKLSQSEVIFYETGNSFPIVNGSHAGNIRSQTPLQPAVLELSIGDSYILYRGANYLLYVEDFSSSDFYTSDSWDKGRPNRVDKDYKQIKRPTTIYYSEAYIPETNINGLHNVFSTSTGSFSHQFGEIKKLYSYDDRLEIYQQKRTGFALVNKDVLYNALGTPQGVVGQQNAVIGQINYFQGEYGIGNNPESFAAYGGRRYFVDAASGVVLRLGGDGITVISNYGMHNYFSDKLSSLVSNQGRLPFRIWGAYDWRFDEYVLAFQTVKQEARFVNNGKIVVFFPEVLYVQGETVAFSELKKKWTTFYSFLPDGMLMADGELLSWNNGNLYRHNTNSLYNNFYGVQYVSDVKTVFNEQPSNMKIYKGIVEESNSKFSCPEITNQKGQVSNLITDDFEDAEGVFNAALLKDINTPNIQNPLIEGDDMRDHVLVVTFRNDSTDFVKLFSVGSHYENSELTNR